MDLLTAAGLSGLDTEAKDKDGHTPNDCFLKCRSTQCAVERKPSKVERSSWATLMKSVREQPTEDPIRPFEHENRGHMLTDIYEKPRDSITISEISIDDFSDEEYMDACDGSDKKSCLHD